MTWDQFRIFVQSPAWWITSILSGVVTIVIAYILRETASRLLSAISERWTRRRRDTLEKQQAIIASLVSSPQERTMFAIEQLRQLAVGIVFLVFGVMFTFMIPLLKSVNAPRSSGRTTGIVAILNIAYATVSILSASYKGLILRKVKKELAKHSFTTIPSNSPPGTTDSGTTPGTGQP